jgi:hypothetical protein
LHLNPVRRAIMTFQTPFEQRDPLNCGQQQKNKEIEIAQCR